MTKFHILCIDDEETILQSLETELSKHFGELFELAFAMSGEGAIEYAQDIKNDGEELALVIADYIMPQMKGDKVLEEIHQIFPKAKKIMLTGQSSTQGVMNAINKADLYRYLEKPWEQQDLLLTAREAITAYKQEREMIVKNEELEILNATLEQKVKARIAELERRSEMLENANHQVSQAFEQLEKSQTKLIQAEKMASQSALIVNVSQAFQNPVNLISNGIEILNLTWHEIQTDCVIEKTETFKELKDDFESTLSDMKISVEEMHKTTLGLQNFSQLSDDTFRLFDLHSGIDAILLILKERWRNTVKVNRDYDETLSEVYCMPNQMNQVFMNLIENALEAIKDKGTITIRTRKQDKLATFEIQNSGSKIAKHLVESIFLPFVTTKPNEFHSGMGLAIAHDIIQKHNGTIELKDSENNETCFVIKIPRAEGGNQ